MLSDEVLAFVGFESEPMTAPHPLTEDSLRRFTQAVMDPDPLFWDSAYAQTTKYGGVVAPPLWPVHAFVRPAGTPDPLDALATDPDFDGVGGVLSTGLPKLPLTQTRLVNGGTEAEFFQYARVGDVITSQARYSAITEREGKSGPMVIVKTETTYTNQFGDVLCVVAKSQIWR